MVRLFDLLFPAKSEVPPHKVTVAAVDEMAERPVSRFSGSHLYDRFQSYRSFVTQHYHQYFTEASRTGIIRKAQRVNIREPGKPIGPRHVVFLANGLAGAPSNWHTILKELSVKIDGNEVLVHASRSNTRLETFDGIDKCGDRLADEMRNVVAQYPTLERVSVIGHSMGGLLLRYATATLFNPEANTVAGLTPAHFITMATPHLGCDGDGVAQVPFIGWAGPLTPILQWISVPTSAMLFRRTGIQFFRADFDVAGSTKPLLIRMTEDDVERGLYFYSALKSFKSRTAYANTGQDHLVGWSNSSLRFKHELPHLPDPRYRGKGVVLQDDIMTAFVKGDSESGGKLNTEEFGRGEDSVGEMLYRLQQLPWRRIDVDFTGSPLSIMSHNHIQARWTWINGHGRNVAIHLAEQLVQLEDICLRLGESEMPSGCKPLPLALIKGFAASELSAEISDPDLAHSENDLNENSEDTLTLAN